ncbi:PREDICTED: uncharacterized protein LOC109233799 [Nicotiana attenuata]|uniref:uncharacterized protein LOC109233799 n=1 Tax=Nicotiana attenuata TaxID=49451 RepID=UPI00090544B8|nr:PREDICTED: uncharacterized protein LOC109233799 [Nicotiana attenuata]
MYGPLPIRGELPFCYPGDEGECGLTAGFRLKPHYKYPWLFLGLEFGWVNMGIAGLYSARIVCAKNRKLAVAGWDEGIRKIQALINDGFTNVQLFGVDLLDDTVNVPVFTQYTAAIDSVPVVVAFDCDSTEDDTDIESVDSDYDSDALGLFERQKKCEVTGNLDRYKTLEKGMTFKYLAEAKEVIGYYAVSNKRGLKVDKSDKRRLRYKCQIGYPFKCLISKDGKDQGVKIKTWRDEHDCGEVFENRRATPVALAHYFKRKIQNNPKFKIKEMKVDLEDRFSLNVSDSKLKRVKRMVLEKLEGSYLDEYNKLEAYAQELRETNPGTDVVIQISKDAMEEGKRRFLRMYVSFQARKSGFKAGLRPFIGLDGTFLKGKCKGMLLVACSQDSCKHFYPLAWAVVDKETKTTWQWFMENLKASLDLKDGEGYTFMSDMQNGLLDAVRNVCPQSYHRYCARHIEANWSKQWNTDEMKKLM